MLELKDINYTVTEESGEQKTIIDGLNLEIEDGRFVVITGPNVIRQEFSRQNHYL